MNPLVTSPNPQFCKLSKIHLSRGKGQPLHLSSSTYRNQWNMQPPALQGEKKEWGARRRRRVREASWEQWEIVWEYSWYVLLCSFHGNTIKARSQSLSAARPPSLSPFSVLLASPIPSLPKQRLPSLSPSSFISAAPPVPSFYIYISGI